MSFDLEGISILSRLTLWACRGMMNARMRLVLREKVFMITDEELWAARAVSCPPLFGRCRHEGYPALSAEQETQETLATEPPERSDKKQKPAQEPAA